MWRNTFYCNLMNLRIASIWLCLCVRCAINVHNSRENDWNHDPVMQTHSKKEKKKTAHILVCLLWARGCMRANVYIRFEFQMIAIRTMNFKIYTRNTMWSRAQHECCWIYGRDGRARAQAKLWIFLKRFHRLRAVAIWSWIRQWKMKETDIDEGETARIIKFDFRLGLMSMGWHIQAFRLMSCARNGWAIVVFALNIGDIMYIIWWIHADMVNAFACAYEFDVKICDASASASMLHV